MTQYLYDSREDTQNHIEVVAKFINICTEVLKLKAEEHDKTKLLAPEKEYFDVYTHKLKTATYGSDEYKTFLKELSVALSHHYAFNRHHPEHFENGISDMNLLDIIEMLCDWYAATKRHNDGDIYKSLEINQKRFNYSDELKGIFKNTIKLLEKMER